MLISEKVITFHTILGEFLVHAGTAKVTKLSPASIHARTQAESAQQTFLLFRNNYS